MKKKLTITFLVLVAFATFLQAQEIETIFKRGSVGGYGALSNKFTKIGGDYANMVDLYGGVYLNNKFFIGLGGGATTNNIPVLPQYSANPNANLSYQFGQCGMVTEYALGSNKALHVVFHLFTGAGFTLQYDRFNWEEHFDNYEYKEHDENWFFVAEPGVQVEVNLTRWMRFSPGVSYRTALGSDSKGLTDRDLSNVSYNATLKFGKF